MALPGRGSTGLPAATELLWTPAARGTGKDSAGLDDDDEIVATLEWAAAALLRTALHDFEGPQ
jgi:hypothetical protein